MTTTPTTMAATAARDDLIKQYNALHKRLAEYHQAVEDRDRIVARQRAEIGHLERTVTKLTNAQDDLLERLEHQPGAADAGRLAEARVQLRVAQELVTLAYEKIAEALAAFPGPGRPHPPAPSPTRRGGGGTGEADERGGRS